MHDPRCYELAKALAADEERPLSEAELTELAQEIHDAAEDFLVHRLTTAALTSPARPQSKRPARP